jgi:hypothetical protein
MINEKLQGFVCDVIAKGQIGYGDLRRLQRDYLPGGITHSEELELLISLNARLVRADKAWAHWFVASVAEFVAKQEENEHPIEEAAGEWVGRLLAESITSFGRKIARLVRRHLKRRHSTQPTNSVQRHLNLVRSHNIQQLSRTGTSENDCSQRTAKRPRCDSNESPFRSGPPRSTVRRAVPPGTMAPAGAGHGWYVPGYLPAVQRSHLINFQSSRASLVLAPCR